MIEARTTQPHYIMSLRPPIVNAHLVRFLSEDLGGSGSFSEEMTERIFFETSIANTASSFSGLFARMDEHQDLILAGMIHDLS